MKKLFLAVCPLVVLTMIWIVIVPAISDWNSGWLASIGWVQGLFGYGVPDFVMVESSHLDRFWGRTIAVVIAALAAFFLRNRINAQIKDAIKWSFMAVCFGMALFILCGRWDYLLEIEGRYEASNEIERLTGIPNRAFCTIVTMICIGTASSICPCTSRRVYPIVVMATLTVSAIALALNVFVVGDMAAGGMYSARRTTAFIVCITATMVAMQRAAHLRRVFQPRRRKRGQATTG